MTVIFFEESTVCAASGIFFTFNTLIFNINFDIYFY